MDNAQKAIMIGVGLFVTILIIAAVMMIVTPALDLLDQGGDAINNLADSIQKQLTDRYDDVTVTGAEVISTVKLYSGYDMILEVKATTNADYLEFGKYRGDGTLALEKQLTYDSENVQSKVSVLSDSSNTTNYVPASATFKAELIKSTSGDVVMGIRFTRVK